MSWRMRLARWLCPELGRQADRWQWYQVEWSHLHRWLGEFPQIDVLLEHMRLREYNHFRPLDEPAIDHTDKRGYWPSEIYQFREKLRAVFAKDLAA